VSTATIALARPAPVAVPRGAVWVGWLADRAVAWRARRQAAAARRQAERAATVRMREAAALRRWAMRMEAVEPALAADLRVAADRHLDAV
jgi:hypothetical protein